MSMDREGAGMSRVADRQPKKWLEWEQQAGEVGEGWTDRTDKAGMGQS